MKSRAPIWDAQAWLENNYRDRNGLPNFFREGGYTFAMKETAEEDYIMVVDAAANQQENESFQLWAINMKINQYRALQLTTTLEYWRYLAEKEKDALSRDKAAGLTLASCRTASERPVKSPRNTYLSSDTIFVEGYRESFGTIVGRFGRSYISHNNKSSYFKTLAMNNIIDLSDDSEGSHLAQVNPEAQNAVKELLHKSPINEDEVDSQCQVFEKLIKKFKREENDDRFLARVVKEIEEARSPNAYLKRIYLQILEAMLYDQYLFTESCSEADHAIKLHGPIFENLFRGSGCRLVWDRIQGPCHMSKAKDSNLALRIVSSSAGTTPDFCIAEHSKKVTLSKSYYDKRKMVVVSLLHLKRHINCVHLSYQEATEFTLPFVICCGLRADIYTIRLVSEDWCAVEKCKDLDIPCCVAEVKEGKIVSYIHHLKSLKKICMNLKDQSAQSRGKKTGMHRFNAKQQPILDLLGRKLWVDPFDGEDAHAENEDTE